MTNALEQIRDAIEQKDVSNGQRLVDIRIILNASQGYVCVPVEQADDLIEREDGRASAYQIAEAALRLVGKRDSVDGFTLLSVVDRYMPSHVRRIQGDES